MTAGTGIGLDSTEKGARVSEVWKDAVATVLWARARAASATYVQGAGVLAVQRNASVGVRIRYQSGDETTLEVQFLGSLDGVSYSPLPQDDAAAAGVKRVRTSALQLYPADFPNTVAKGALASIAPWDDGIMELIGASGFNFIAVQTKRTGGSAGGAGFLTIEACGGFQT